MSVVQGALGDLESPGSRALVSRLLQKEYGKGPGYLCLWPVLVGISVVVFALSSFDIS